jgi:hypothetical protein
MDVYLRNTLQNINKKNKKERNKKNKKERNKKNKKERNKKNKKYITYLLFNLFLLLFNKMVKHLSFCHVPHGT